MSQYNDQEQPSGLVECFDSFGGIYCYRKLIEMILSIIFIIAGVAILVIFIQKYQVSRPFWLVSVLGLLLSSLLVNILFCFYNEKYWLYATEDYFYSMYYLTLVSFICYHYVLKHSGQQKEDLMRKLNITLNLQSDQPKSTQKIVYFCIVGLLVTFYLAIFVASVIYEINHQTEEYKNPASDEGTHYCEETWYLVLNLICVVLSFVVVVVMAKSQNQEYKKMLEFQEESDREKANRRRSSHSSGSSKSSESKESKGSKSGFSNEPNLSSEPSVPSNANATVNASTTNHEDNSNIKSSYDAEDRNYQKHDSSSSGVLKVNNPFKNLWIWVGINVACQTINLVQAGLLLKASPPECMIIRDDYQNSNLLSLFFEITTFYLGYAATLWFILYVKILQVRTGVDRTVLYSEEYKIEGNIELFVPSKGQTITFQEYQL